MNAVLYGQPAGHPATGRWLKSFAIELWDTLKFWSIVALIGFGFGCAYDALVVLTHR